MPMSGLLEIAKRAIAKLQHRKQLGDDPVNQKAADVKAKKDSGLATGSRKQVIEEQPLSLEYPGICILCIMCNRCNLSLVRELFVHNHMLNACAYVHGLSSFHSCSLSLMLLGGGYCVL